MEFRYTPELLEYMHNKNKKHIAVEVATSDHSDFDVTELYFRFVKESQIPYLRDKKRYVVKETSAGFVLLPPYRLHYDNIITFGLKKFLIFHSITQTGISL